MNRLQRRAAIKNNITAKELSMVLTQESTVKSTVNAYSIVVAYVLYRRLNFGKKKIIMTTKQIERLFDEVNYDHITIAAMKKVLLDELDLDIVDRNFVK